MVLIAHMADTHLGYAQYRLSEREEDVYQLLDSAYSVAIEDRASAVVISGDVFHVPRPPNKALLKLLKSVKRAGERGIKTIVVAGEHDQVKRKGDVQPLALLAEISGDVVPVGGSDPQSVISSRYVLETGGAKVVFYGVNALPRLLDRVERYRQVFKKLEAEGKESGSKRVLVGHVPVEGLMSGNFEPSVPIADLPAGFDYYAFGHLHVRYVGVTAKGGVLAYPGSLDILSRQEVEEWSRNGKGLYLVDLSGDEPRVNKVDLDVRPQYVVEGGKEEVLKEISSILQNRFYKLPLVHIRVRLRRSEEAEFRAKLEAALKKKVLDYRLEVYREDPSLGVAYSPGEKWSEVDVISRAFKISAEAALALVRLKDCLSNRPAPEECESEIEEVLSYEGEIAKSVRR